MKLRMIKLKQAGQGMTEYIIIVALIAVAAISVTQLFGSTLRHQMGAIAKEVGGDNAQPTIDNSKKAGQAAADAAKTNRSLSTFGNQIDEGKKGDQ